MSTARAGRLGALDAARWKRVESVLDRALELPAGEVSSFLEAECRGDADLRAEVEALLSADREAGTFLERPATELALEWIGGAPERADERDSDRVGQRIGAWQLVREVGRGGMGAVYRANRADGQFEQTVALKLVKRGLDTDEILRRFLRERRILARLDHPHIARLVDGGVTGDGLPWFAMEFVEGRPITTWCDERRSSIDERLRLFRAVCEAVQYAHRNLVVHRDLKPSNIFVTDTGEVKLLDFGIARLIRDEATDETLTLQGPQILTPRYAAPEQLRGETATTATDLYGLGVVLYELLAGARPHAQAPGFDELRESILHRDPAPPSRVRLEWQRRLAGDLDNIVLLTLRKEPSQRYPTVEALISDLDRFRDGVPVRATPPSARDRARKFVRRNRAAVFAVAAVAVGLVVGLVAAMWQVVAAALVVASLAGALVVSLWQTRAARREARKAEEVKRFLLAVFEVSDPSQSLGQSVTARELLDRGAKRIERELEGQPALRVEMLGALGEVYVKLGLFEPGLALVEREMGLLASLPRTRPEARAAALRRRGNLLTLKGDLESAEAALREATDLRRTAGAEASAEYAEDMDQLAAVLRPRGALDEAERLLRASHDIRVRRFGPRSPEVAISLNNLAIMAREGGRFDEAEALYRECLDIRREKLPPDHPDVASTLVNVVALQRQTGRFGEAESLARESLALHRKLYGEDHAFTAGAANALASVLLKLARFDEAERVLREVLVYWERHEGRAHPNAVATLNNLASACLGRGDLATAETLQREAVDGWRARFGNDHLYTAAGLLNLAVILRERGAFEESEAALARALEIRRQARGEEHSDISDVLHQQSLLADRRGLLEEAETLCSRALAIRERHLGARNPTTAASRALFGSLLRRRGASAEARSALREAIAALEESVPPEHPDLAAAKREFALIDSTASA
jgi:eukaryotic-like serine/threonine-protein kinase